MGQITKLMLAITLAGISAGVMAEQNKITPVEQHLISTGAKITQHFTSSSGLPAIVADSGTEKRLFYITPDGNSLIVGMVFDANGNNTSNADLKRAGVSSSDSIGTKVPGDVQLQELWTRAEKLHWVQDGNSGKVIYVFFDGNCRYCHTLWSTLRSWVQSGKAQVRWLPVAILSDTSKGLGAAIYESKNPVDAMDKMVNHLLQPIKVSDRDNRDMSLNLLLLKDTGYTGTPALMFKRGNKIVSMMGGPSSDELAALLQ